MGPPFTCTNGSMMIVEQSVGRSCHYTTASLRNQQQSWQTYARPARLHRKGMLNQGSFLLLHDGSDSRREVRIRADTANADRATSGREGTKAVPTERKRLPIPDRPKWGLPNLLSNFPKTSRLQYLAAGIVTSVVGVQICAGLLEKVEQVPLLPQLEIFIGTLFSINLAAKFFGGGEGRVRLESFVEDMVDRIKGVKGFEDEDDEEPSMLDVQIKSLVAEYVHVEETRDLESKYPTVSTVTNEAALATALRDFVRKRETKSRRINALLRKDNEELIKEKGRAKQLEQLLAQRASETKQLTGANATIQAEKSDLLAKVAFLGSRLDTVTFELESMNKERRTLQDLNAKLELRSSDVEVENEDLRWKVFKLENASAVAATAVEAANARRVEELLIKERQHTAENQKALLEQRAVTQQMEAALAKLEAERNKAAEFVLKLEGQLSEAVTEMEERDNHMNWLQSSLAEAQRRTEQNEKFVQELQNELAAVHDQVANSQQEDNAHAELAAVLEAERKRYAESASQLESQLAAVQREKEEAATHITRLEEALAQSELQVSATEQSAEELQTALAWAAVAESASPAALSPAKPAPHVAPPNAGKADSAERSAKYLTSVDSAVESEAPVSPRKRSVAKSESKSPTNVKLEMDPATSPVKPAKKMNPRDLQAHARSIRGNHVDVTLPARGQEEGIEALVRELVVLGAVESWARKYVLDSMAYERRKMRKQEEQGSP